jgi:hypothetical protein
MTNHVFEDMDAKRAQFRDEGFVIVRAAELPAKYETIRARAQSASLAVMINGLER